jgi:hypothetical protein
MEFQAGSDVKKGKSRWDLLQSQTKRNLMTVQKQSLWNMLRGKNESSLLKDLCDCMLMVQIFHGTPLFLESEARKVSLPKSHFDH